MITVQQAIENLEDIQRRFLWNTAGDETFDLAIKCLRAYGKKMFENDEEEEKE